MAWTNNIAAIETPTQVPLQHVVSVFPFNAALFPPKGSVFSYPDEFLEKLEAAEVERLKTLEESGKDEQTRHMELIKENLIGIIRNRLLNESARVAASRLLFDICESESADKGMTEAIAAATEKAQKAAAGALTPSKRRSRKAGDEVGATQ